MWAHGCMWIHMCTRVGLSLCTHVFTSVNPCVYEGTRAGVCVCMTGVRVFGMFVCACICECVWVCGRVWYLCSVYIFVYVCVRVLRECASCLSRWKWPEATWMKADARWAEAACVVPRATCRPAGPAPHARLLAVVSLGELDPEGSRQLGLGAPWPRD